VEGKRFPRSMMHADLMKLLDLQAKDALVAESDRRLAAVGEETAVLDQVLQGARDNVEAARRALAEGQRRRDELEAKIESYRTLQERRQQRLEHVRNPKEASTLMAELDLARSVMAKEEGEWVRSADAVIQLELRLQGEELNLKAVEAAQAGERASVAERRAALQAERDAVLRQRDASAALIDKPLRSRYDRLRRTRSTDVIVPLIGGACGGCHTTVPLNRRSQIRSGAVLDGCEACGAILYPPEQDGSS
jgi:predicted  nucleic acid-binding Zn-ribbon protein